MPVIVLLIGGGDATHVGQYRCVSKTYVYSAINFTLIVKHVTGGQPTSNARDNKNHHVFIACQNVQTDVLRVILERNCYTYVLRSYKKTIMIIVNVQ